MNCLFIEAEAKIFCLLTIVFLGVFQTKNLKPQWSKLRYVFLFSAAGSVLSISQSITTAFSEEPYVYNLLNISFGLCCALLFGCLAYFSLAIHCFTY